MGKLTVALISGGSSSEREISLKSGAEVFEALDKNKYRVLRYDPKSDLGRLLADASKIDVALVMLHGQYGEDGTVQGMLDLLGIPYQGSGVLGSAAAMNKIATKQLYALSDIPVPPYIALNKNDDVNLEEYIDRLGLPMVVKPVVGGSSIGITIADSKTALKKSIDTAFECDDTIVLEKYIKGTELTVAVTGNDQLEALPVVEIIPEEEYAFFDYEAKYMAGATKEICPARIDDALTKKAQAYGKKAHRALFCRGYSRTDMILEGDNIHVLETNTIPGMTRTSLLPLAAKTAGISFSGLLDKLIELGLE